MEPDSAASRLQQQQQERAEAHASQIQAGTQFGSVEEVLRHDRAATPLPGTIETRLKAHVAREAPPPRPWWKRWLEK